MSSMSMLKLKPLQAVISTPIASRTLSTSSHILHTPALISRNFSSREPSSSQSVNFGFQFGYNAKASFRSVQTSTASILGKQEFRVMTAEDLEKRINHLMNLTTEAKHCIQDCDESTETEFEEEFESAKMAVDSASIAYSELLEELALTNEGVPLLNEIRKMYAPTVEDLRSELKALLKMKAV